MRFMVKIQWVLQADSPVTGRTKGGVPSYRVKSTRLYAREGLARRVKWRNKKQLAAKVRGYAVPTCLNRRVWKRKWCAQRSTVRLAAMTTVKSAQPQASNRN
jgi:hypothetical protein